MSRTRKYIAVSFAAMTVLSPAAVISTQAMVPGPLGKAPGNAAKSKLAGADSRYLTYVNTDKPIYRAGEKVYARGVMLNAANRKPFTDGNYASASISLVGPKGDIVSTAIVRTEGSVWAYDWTIPSGQAGGEYTLKATYPYDGFAPAIRKFDIRAFRAPRLNSHITFLRDGYGPGEKVTATLEVKRAEGGIPAGAKVAVNARIDGVSVDGASAVLDEKGLATVSFDLPKHIERGEGTLALIIHDGGVVETASKTIPILLQAVDVQVYPEGGDLIGGFKNRVYVQAIQPNGKPADVEGYIVSDEDKNASEKSSVAKFRTAHEGRGRFEFTPDAELQYFLKITKPVGIKKLITLPDIKPRGTVIASDQQVYKKGQPITVQVGSSNKKYRVTVSSREVELASRQVDINGRPRAARFTPTPVSLNVPSDAEGVLTVTVWDENNQPLAERLVFHEAVHPLHVSINSVNKNYVPGEDAKVTVKTTDDSGKPISAVVGLSVTDESVLQMIEKREQAPRLPVMVFLEPEVKDLADANVYLDPANPKAAQAVDLLLGTQGWRRFAFVELDKFLRENGDDAKRVVATTKPPFLSDLKRGMSKISGVAIGSGVGKPNVIPMHGYHLGKPERIAVEDRILAARLGEPRQQLPEELGRVQGPRDLNLFQVEPTVLDERHYTSGRAERHQKTSPTLPEGAPVPDNDGDNGNFFLNQAPPSSSIDRYSSFQPPRPPVPTVVAVREFAHTVRPGRKAGERADFAETLYWNAGVKTDEKTGEATVSFGLNDSVTTFQVHADGFSNSGSIGASSLGLKSVQPFYAEAKLPLEVTTGDRVLLPVSLVNATDNLLKSIDLHFDLSGPLRVKPITNKPQQLDPEKRVRCLQPLEVGFGEEVMNFIMQAKAGAYQDNVTRKLSIKAKGFPVEKGFGGLIEPGQKVSFKINVEKNVVPGSVTTTAQVFPSPLANLTSALERMIQDPCGCFEQTSSTSYPLTMAQQYFVSHIGVAPQLIEASREKLDKGYKQLIGFWCPDRGYEWFGENPGHEALTAFGLLHFNDMSQVRVVDTKMVAATRDWLMKQKDGQGGFTRKRRALHSWIEDKDCSNAYIVWALLETGESAANLKPEIAALRASAAKSQNSYVIALAANALYLAGEKAEAKKEMTRLASLQKTDGSVEKISASIVGSGGESLEVEGTSLAALAWLREPEFTGNVEKSIKYLADSCKAGRYGSTQATVLALRTIVAYDKKHATPKEPGKLRVYVDGQPVGDWVTFNKSVQESIKLPDLSENLSAGEHNIQIQMEGGSPMPYSLAAKYKIESPLTDKDCKVALKVKMAQDKVVEGASTEANVVVTNVTKEPVPTPVAIVGLPGGMEPRHDQLKELVKKHVIDSYEVLGREVVLYWRGLPANAEVHVPLSLIAAIPGTYTGSASRAYLYYTDEHKAWVEGAKVEIVPKN